MANPARIESVDPARITLARQLRGLRKSELAELVDLSPGAIGQLEQGVIQPRREVLVRLAFALRVPIEFFSRRSTSVAITEHEVHFRRLRSSKKLDRGRVLARMAVLIELVGAL